MLRNRTNFKQRRQQQNIWQVIKDQQTQKERCFCPLKSNLLNLFSVNLKPFAHW